MAWEKYRRIRQILEQGSDPDGALAAISAERAEMAAIADHLAVIESEAWKAKGNLGEAIAVLLRAIDAGTHNFWTYYNLAHFYREAGQPDLGMAASQRAHAACGWVESERNGYRYTHDYFAPNIDNWQRWFAESMTAAPINCLEIGAWQGGSTCWLLDKVIAPRGGNLISVDTFEGSSEHTELLQRLGAKLEDLFDDNVRRTGHGAMNRKIVGRSQDVLRWLPNDRFDFIYIDGAHEAKYVIQDAALAWPLLREGGYLLFDDVGYEFSDKPAQNTVIAVDAFVAMFAEDIEVIYRGWQLLARKKRAADAA